MRTSYADEDYRDQITGGYWSRDNIHTVEDFANAIQGKVKGEWS